MSVNLSLEGIEQQPLKDFTEQAYLDYAMYVILDRALPNIADGLKPVQRRIIFAMSELGLFAKAKHKKSARTVGDVLGKYHPHGDSACYEAMVLMAQNFSYRYPLVDGQGNWGSADDPKSFAAMRYTESKLSAYADVLLGEINQNTVEWLPNFDGTLEEPRLLPARLPNILLNGTMGIAVGMATDIPPHNLTEVGNACIYLLENSKDNTLQDVLNIVQGPDYPTDAEIITPKQDIANIYKTGTGSIKMRSVFITEGADIIVTALPHMVSGAKVLEQIASQIQTKKLPQILDLRDESDHENPTRLIIVLRSNKVNATEVMDHLFATTDLEKNYRVNMNMIGLDKKPRVKNLLQILSEWLEYRMQTVKKRLQSRLDKIIDRIHILDGLLIAFLNIDEVINIIRSEDHPKKILMTKFKLSDLQADAVLDLKLRHLAKLEEVKITGEQSELNEERVDLEKTLNSENKLKTLIKKEIKEDIKTYGDSRRAPIVARSEAKVLSVINNVPSEPMTIILSDKGWVRSGKGHDLDPTALSYKSGDSYRAHVLGMSDFPVVFFDSKGRSYTLVPSTLPSVRGYGEPITSRVTPESGATFKSIITAQTNNDLYLLITDKGYGFIAKFEELLTKNKKGKAVVNLATDANLLNPLSIPTNSQRGALLAMMTLEGKLLIIEISDIPLLNKGKGRRLIKTEDLNKVVIIPKDSTLTLKAARKKLELTTKEIKYYIGSVGQRGKNLPQGLNKVMELIVL